MEGKSTQIIQRTSRPDENDELVPKKPLPPAPDWQSQLESVAMMNKNKWGGGILCATLDEKCVSGYVPVTHHPVKMCQRIRPPDTPPDTRPRDT